MDYQGERDSPEDNGILAWDPKSPTLLIRVRGGGEGNPIVIGKEDAGTGAGCNKFESSALLRLLDARDDYLKKVATNSDSYPAIQGLCQNYCQALSECCEEWDEYLAKAGDNMEIVNVLSKSSYSPENLDLLKLMYSLTQLSGIYLVLPKRKRGFGHHSERSNMFSGYADMVKMNGAATADTVRFLRRHCLTFEEDEYGEAELRQMYAAVQPDQLDGDLYWAVVEKRMISGRLEDAWVLLSNHSSCKRVQEHENKMDLGSNDYHRSTLEVDRRGFEALKGVLLTAPIPGGRNTKEDSGYAQNSADDGSLFDELESVQGIKASAYRHWDMNASILRSGESKKFDSQQAYGLWTTWQESIRTNPDLIELCKHIPQLRKLLDLLCGDFRDIRFNSWKEELCAGLLYQTPDIKLDDMHSRAVAIMVEYNYTAVTLLDDAIIKIMKGNAGNVLDLTSLFGGQTSAALPAVMTSLLAQLFFDAGTMRDNEIEECTIHAASAIRSSFAAEADDAAMDPNKPNVSRDLGAIIAVRLLLPFIDIGSSLTYTASLVDTMEHHYPDSDPLAEDLLLMCHKLVERKNARVLDGCDSICLARFLHYKKEGLSDRATKWLVRGIELEASLYCGADRTGAWQTLLSPGVCFRKLVAEFSETAQTLLKYLVGDEDKGSATKVFETAILMIEAQKESSVTRFVPAVKILEHVAIMAKETSERKKNATSIIASSIVACLEEKSDDEDNGTVSSLAPPCMQWDLLRLAVLMLERDAAKGDLENTASFDVQGLGVLLSCFTINVEYMKMTNRIQEIPSENLYKMRLALGEGLKRAYIAENAMRAKPPKKPTKLSAEGVYAANFDEYPLEVQELAVRNMLERY